MLLATLFATASPGSPSLRSLEARVAELTEQVQTLKDASAHDELTKTFVQGDGDHDGMLSLREFSKMHSAGVFNFERKLAHRPSIDEAFGLERADGSGCSGAPLSSHERLMALLFALAAPATPRDSMATLGTAACDTGASTWL